MLKWTATKANRSLLLPVRPITLINFGPGYWPHSPFQTPFADHGQIIYEQDRAVPWKLWRSLRLRECLCVCE